MLRKILAVDDSALIHQMYKLFLSRYKNCKLVSAMNGLEALDKLAQEEGIDLILLDIMLPDLDGYEIFQLIRKNPLWDDIKVICLTAKNRDVDVAKGLNLGVDAYITKPFSNADLLAKIRQLLPERVAT